MTMADFEASGLFSETKVATKRVSPVEEKLLGLLHAGRQIEFFELALQRRLNILISGATCSPDERSVGKECVGTGSSVWSSVLLQQQTCTFYCVPPHQYY